MSQFVVFTPEQFRALDDKLTEISQGGGGADLGITGASVGEVAAVAAVDGDGKPTAWTHASAASASSVPDAGSVSSTGLISIKHGSTTLFTVQLPLYAGGVS